MRRVFEGGVGCCRGGIEERSIDIGVLDPFDETGRDVGGEVSDLSVAILVVDCCPWRLSRLMRGFLERIVTKVVLVRLDLRRQVGDCCGFIYLRSVVEVWLLATCVHKHSLVKKANFASKPLKRRLGGRSKLPGGPVSGSRGDEVLRVVLEPRRQDRQGKTRSMPLGIGG